MWYIYYWVGTRLRLNLLIFIYIHIFARIVKKKQCAFIIRGARRAPGGVQSQGAQSHHTEPIHEKAQRKQSCCNQTLRIYIFSVIYRNAIKYVYKFETVRLNLFTYWSNLFRTCWIISRRRRYIGSPPSVESHGNADLVYSVKGASPQGYLTARISPNLPHLAARMYISADFVNSLISIIVV